MCHCEGEVLCGTPPAGTETWGFWWRLDGFYGEPKEQAYLCQDCLARWKTTKVCNLFVQAHSSEQRNGEGTTSIVAKQLQESNISLSKEKGLTEEDLLQAFCQACQASPRQVHIVEHYPTFNGGIVAYAALADQYVYLYVAASGHTSLPGYVNDCHVAREVAQSIVSLLDTKRVATRISDSLVGREVSHG